MPNRDELSTAQWISWMGATIVTILGFAAFAYATFETKDHAIEVKGDTVQRLDRIESKLDFVINRGK
jgi:hypothetical protein